MNDPRRSSSPGEQFRDRLFGSLASRDAGDTNIVGAVVVIAVIVLLIPRGQAGNPELWLVVALVFAGAVVETARIMRSGLPLRDAIVAAGRQLSGPLVFVLGAALFTQAALLIRDTPIPHPVAVGAALAVTVVAWLAVWRLLRA